MINEELAKRAWENTYSRNYPINNDTKEWNGDVQVAEEILKTKYAHISEDIRQAALERFKIKTAEWINRRNQLDAGHVSWFLAGPANYNMKKQEQWLEKTNEMMKKFDYIFDINNYIHEKRNEVVQESIESKEYVIGTTKVIQNTELNRLQLEFEGKPNEDVRETLKKNGFKWSPKNSVWQRQLTTNAIYSLKRISEVL